MYKELERLWWGTASGVRLKELRKVIKYQVGLPSFRYDIFIQQECLANRSDYLSTEYKFGICARRIGGKNSTHDMANEFSLSRALFSPVLLTGLNKYSRVIVWVQPSAEAGRFTFLLFLSFISQVFGLVSEFEYWSLFIIASFVWKELVLFVTAKGL
jgi:hypothetical protein